MKNKPLISVILPIFNSEKYIEEAIRSILDQTYKKFELILINDGSTDGTKNKLKQISDERITLLNNKMNRGLVFSLNKGIKYAKGKYIARMDADDISQPERFEKQVKFLEKNTDYVMVGTGTEIVDVNGDKAGRYLNHPTTNEVLQFKLLFGCPFVHSSMMIRADILKELNGYCNIFPEDYDLWSKIVSKYKVANLGEILHQYRESVGNISKTRINAMANGTRAQMMKNITDLLGNTNYDCVTIRQLVYLAINDVEKITEKPNFIKLNMLIERLKEIIVQRWNVEDTLFLENECSKFKQVIYNRYIRIVNPRMFYFRNVLRTIKEKLVS